MKQVRVDGWWIVYFGAEDEGDGDCGAQLGAYETEQVLHVRSGVGQQQQTVGKVESK